MLDGKTFAEATMVVALGITMTGDKRFLGVVETDTENEKMLTPFLPVIGRAGPRCLPGASGDRGWRQGLRAAVRKAFRHRALVPPRTISQAVLSGHNRDARERANTVDAIERETREHEGRGFDIDTMTESDIVMPTRAPSSVTMGDLDRMIGRPDVMPPGTDVQPMGHREYGLLAPGMTERLRVTTDPEYFEEHAESMELWSPAMRCLTRRRSPHGRTNRQPEDVEGYPGRPDPVTAHA